MTGKVLVADAVPTNRIVLRSILQTACYDVALAGSVDEAIARQRALRPDVIVVAQTIGTDATRAALYDTLRLGQHPAPRILALCPDRIAAREAALVAGADDVMGLPIDQPLLLARLRRLQRREARRDPVLDLPPEALGGMSEPGAPYTGTPLALRLVMARGATDDALRPRLAAALPGAIRLLAAAPGGAPGDGRQVLDLLVSARADGSDVRDLMARGEDTRVLVHLPGATEAGASRLLDFGACDLLHAGMGETELRQRIERAARLCLRASGPGLASGRARPDPLTGLAARAEGLQLLSELCRTPARQPFAALLFDIEALAALNRRHGQAAGDTALVTTAATLRRVLRPGDGLCRFGDSAFLMLLPGTGSAEARRIGLRASHALREQTALCPETGHPLTVRVRLGIALAHRQPGPEAGPHPDALIALAEKAVQAAKHSAEDADMATGRPAA